MELSTWIAAKREENKRLRVDGRNATPSIRDFGSAVATYRNGLSVVAELSRATLPDSDIARWVRACDEADVAAVCVGTDAAESQGRIDDLDLASKAAGLAVAQRDLILTQEQLYLARQHQADCTLLTAAAVQAGELKRLIDLSASMHMAAAVLVSTPVEMDAAVSAGARVLLLEAGDDALLDRAPKRSILLVRLPYAPELDVARYAKRADGLWVYGAWVQQADPAAALRELATRAEQA